MSYREVELKDVEMAEVERMIQNIQQLDTLQKKILHDILQEELGRNISKFGIEDVRFYITLYGRMKMQAYPLRRVRPPWKIWKATREDITNELYYELADGEPEEIVAVDATYAILVRNEEEFDYVWVVRDIVGDWYLPVTEVE